MDPRSRVTHWNGVRRTDGLCIAEGLDGWIVLPRDGDAIDKCPGCARPITSPYYAKIIADLAYPLEQPA